MTTTEIRKSGDQFCPTSPFVCIEGAWFVITQWRPDTPVPPTISLRALSDAEAAWLEPELVNAAADVWARLFRDDNAIEHGADVNDDDG